MLSNKLTLTMELEFEPYWRFRRDPDTKKWELYQALRISNDRCYPPRWDYKDIFTALEEEQDCNEAREMLAL